MTRILVAGVGNVLRGDDGFGVLALERLRRGRFGSHPSIRWQESGIAGVSLVQELMDGFDTLIILDAVDRNGAPGKLYFLEPDLHSIRRGLQPGASVDLHEAGPESVLRMAAAAGVVPKEVFLVGAQVVDCDGLGAKVSPAVERAVQEAVRRVEALLEARLASRVELEDEILQILYWLKGEGLAEDAGAVDLERWLAMNALEIEPALLRLCDLALVEETASGRFRLTSTGAREGGRRFADEFANMTKPGHGECGDPDCECNETGDPADCRHYSA
jgi:hydrogenase maturation protease